MRKNFIQNVCILLIFNLLIACSYSTSISRYSGRERYFNSSPTLLNYEYPQTDIYTLYERAASGFVPIETIRLKVERRAEIFAERQGKTVVFLGEKTSQPPYILGNFPRIQIVFALVDKK